MIGPRSCALTGITFTPVDKVMYDNVQHPGMRAIPIP